MEEVADVGGQQVGDLQSGEVPAAVELGPVHDVVVLLGQGPYGLEDVVGQDDHPDRHRAGHLPARGFAGKAGRGSGGGGECGEADRGARGDGSGSG